MYFKRKSIPKPKPHIPYVIIWLIPLIVKLRMEKTGFLT